MERKFHGSESYLCGLFAPWNESAEERKGLESPNFGDIAPKTAYTFCAATRTLSKNRSHSKIKTGRLASGILVSASSFNNRL